MERGMEWGQLLMYVLIILLFINYQNLEGKSVDHSYICLMLVGTCTEFLSKDRSVLSHV